MRGEEFLDRIDETRSLAFLREMVRQKSYSETEEEIALARHMAVWMEKIGLETELQPVAGDRRNAIGRWRGAGGGRSLMFNGHLDTNPATDGWTVDPWEGVTDSSFVYGIGVSNMKAGDAAAFSAVRTLIEAGATLKGDVILEYVVGELQGGVGTIAAIEAGERADCFINCEPTDLAGLTLHAGAFDYIVELRGVTRHISKREEAVDAIEAACRLIPRLNAMTFHGAATEAHLAVNRSNVGVFRAALAPDFQDWRPPQIADYARLVGTGRYGPSQSEDGVIADIRALLDALEREMPGLRASVTKQAGSDTPTMLPFEVDHASPIVDAVARAHMAVRGAEQTLGPVRPYCFYGTDAAHLKHRAGMEGIVCGPGGRYNTLPDERVDIPDYLDAIRIYLLAIIEICGLADE